MRALIAVILTIFIVAGAASVLWFGYNEFADYSRKMDAQLEQQDERAIALEARIEEQQDQLQEQREQLGDQQNLLADQEQELTSLQMSAAEKEQLAEVQGALDKDIVNLDDLRQALTTQITELVTDTQTLTQTLSTVEDGHIALQQDLNIYSRTLEDLGVELDGLKKDVTILQENGTALAGDLTAVESELSAADVDGLRQAVFLFRLWQMIARARIRLAEQNPGLAEGDVELAYAAVAEFIENGPEETIEPLIRVERRLLLAAENLPDDPDLAISGLDLAWREIDVILVNILGTPSSPGSN